MLQLEHVFAETLRALDPPRPFAVAVSGGPDSTALMRLAAPYDPLVLTVDHGLRPEAAEEAETVREWASALSLRQRTLRWEGLKPAAGLQAAARSARYALLTAACEQAGVRSVLTGHTLDDQIETVVMRRDKGSGNLGLSGMPSQALLGQSEVRLVRPLLATRKTVLGQWLEQRGQHFLIDPSNTDLRFDRARLRQGDAKPVAVEVLVSLQQARVALEHRAITFLYEHAVASALGLAVAGAALAALDAELVDAVLAALIRRIGGRHIPGTRAERERLASALSHPEAFRARTLGGALIRPSRVRDGLPGRVWIVFTAEKAGNPPSPGFYLPMGQFVQLLADGSFSKPGVA